MDDNPMWKYGLLAGLGLGAIVEWDTIRLAYRTGPRDVSHFLWAMRLLRYGSWMEKNNITVPKIFWEACKRHPDKVMLVSADTGEEWTYQDMENYSNRVAHFLIAQGYAPGDVLGLFMTNKPKFAAILLGMAKVGVVAALINTNLRQESLIHCIANGNCQGLIYDILLQDAVHESQSELCFPETKAGLSGRSGLICADAQTSQGSETLLGLNLDRCLKEQSSSPVSRRLRQSLSAEDHFVYIYTSGTTGLPKAAPQNHIKCMMASSVMRYSGAGPNDRVYTSLPLYHSAALWFSLLFSWNVGATLIIRSKFSATNFWKDCVRYEASCAQYIGEICRYLLGEALRDPRTGLCIKAKPGQVGEFVGKVRDRDRGGPENFKAYLGDPGQTNKKIVRDVWKAGDVAFRSGDLMVLDSDGWLYFLDRTGDTFRWNGENVATSEVEAILSGIIGHTQVAVYGVQVAGHEGKAGMATILDPDQKVDLVKLAKAVKAKLPRYARPIFIRLAQNQAELELTSTYKLRKAQLREEAFNLDLIQDPVYFSPEALQGKKRTKGGQPAYYQRLEQSACGELKPIMTAKL